MATRAMTALLTLLTAFGPSTPVFAVTRARPVPAAVVSSQAGVAGRTLLVGPAVTLAPSAVLTHGAPALGVTASPLLAAPADAPKAPAAVPVETAPLATLPAAAAPAGERTAELIERLSPEAAARVPGEEAKTLSGELLGEGAARRVSGAEPVLAAESVTPRLARGAAAVVAPADGPASPVAPRERRGPNFRERLHYLKLLTGSFVWYMTVNVTNKWRSHRAQLAKARAEGPVAVSRQRDFFAAMRTTGMSGHFYVLGGSALEDHEVIDDMRQAFARYFDHPAIGHPERDAYENFMARARLYKAGRRSHSYLYKTIRDAMLKAALLPPARLTAFFDAQIAEGVEREAMEFQTTGEQARVLEDFRQALFVALDREDPRSRSRVLAAVVLGSFASGAAGPGSDFDVELVTANGTDDRVKPFSEAIVAEWKARGGHQRHPVTVHDHASRPSRASLDLVHSADYIIVTRSPQLYEELSRAPGEGPAFTVDRARSLRGRAGIALQSALVRSAIWTEEFRSLFR